MEENGISKPVKIGKNSWERPTRPQRPSPAPPSTPPKQSPPKSGKRQ